MLKIRKKFKMQTQMQMQTEVINTFSLSGQVLFNVLVVHVVITEKGRVKNLHSQNRSQVAHKVV